MLYTTKHKKKVPIAKVSPFYKKSTGKGLPDSVKELNQGSIYQPCEGGFELFGYKVLNQPLN